MTFQVLNPFRKPKAEELVKTNLEEYKRQLVVQEAAAAYHTKMAEYYREGIARLESPTKP
jgi:hypothetical protein